MNPLLKNSLIASMLVVIFFLLHYFVYLNNASGQVPILQSYTDEPVDFAELVLCEEKKPTYLNPFRKVTFSYQVVENGIRGECNIQERAASFFTSKMEPLAGDPYEYWNGFEEDGFGRPQVGYDYANIIFFLVQYSLVIATVGLLGKAIKTKMRS